MSISPNWSPPFAAVFLSSIMPPMANAKPSVKRAHPLTDAVKARPSGAKATLSSSETAKSPSEAEFGAIRPQETSPDLTFNTSLIQSQADENNTFLRNLLVPIAGGDQSALAGFYDATVSRVYSIALRIVRRPEMAEEVVSDVYMQVWRDAARYDFSRGRVLAWLLIITRSRALDMLRRQDEAFSHPEPQNLIAEPQDDRNNPQDLLLVTQSNSALGAALRTLSPLQRQLIALAFFKGLSHSEIVDHAGIPLGSVKTHIRRALTILREALGDAENRGAALGEAFGDEFGLQLKSHNGNNSKTTLKKQGS